MVKNNTVSQVFSNVSAVYLMQTEPEPEVHGAEGGVQLGRVLVHVTEGGAEHGEPVERDDSAGRVDHKVFTDIGAGGAAPEDRLGRVAGAAGEHLCHLHTQG